MDQLEREVKELREENKELRAALGMDAKQPTAIVKAAGKEETLTFGGLLQVQADFGDKGDSRFATGNDRFYLRRARLNGSGKFMEDFTFRVELDLFGTLSETAGLRAQLVDGFLNWSRYEFAMLRLGQFKTPFGYEQLYFDAALPTIERSLANDRLTLSRQIGGQLAGDFFAKRLSYALGAFNGNNVNNNFNDNNEFLYVGRLAGAPWQGKLFDKDAKWTLGANAYYSEDASITGQPAEFGFDSTPGTPGADNIFAGERTGVGFDTQFHLGEFELWLEYLRARLRPASGIPSGSFDSDGFYVQASYYVVPQKLQFVFKYDTFDPDRGIAGNSTDTWTVGVNYYIRGNDLKLQLDYLLVDAAGFPDGQNKVILRLQTMF